MELLQGAGVKRQPLNQSLHSWFSWGFSALVFSPRQESLLQTLWAPLLQLREPCQGLLEISLQGAEQWGEDELL